MIDVSKLIPSYEYYKFVDVDGEERKVKIFVPFGYNMIAEKYESDKKNYEDVQMQILHLVLSSQFDFMDIDWIKTKVPGNVIEFLCIQITDLKIKSNEAINDIDKKKLKKAVG